MAVAMIGPKFYAWDRNGKPLAFGKLYTYQARTNTPKPTYQSEDQVVENTNPVILNGEGYANVYLDGSYKMVLKDDKDNEIWSSDPVTSAQATEWVNCAPASYVSPDSVRVAGNVTDKYEIGRRVRIDNNVSEYSYSTIVSSVYAVGNTDIQFSDSFVTTGVVGICASVIGVESRPSDQVFNFKTLDDARASLLIKVGDALNIKERTLGNGGGGFWDVVDINSVSPSPDPSYGGIVSCSGNTDLALVLRAQKYYMPKQFGAVSGQECYDAVKSCINAAGDGGLIWYGDPGDNLFVSAGQLPLHSNQRHIFNGAKLSRPDAEEINKYAIFYDDTGIDNVIFKGGFLRGNSDNNVGSVNAFSAAIHLKFATNIALYEMDCQGASSGLQVYGCDDVRVYDSELIANNLTGISGISNRVKVKRSKIKANGFSSGGFTHEMYMSNSSNCEVTDSEVGDNADASYSLYVKNETSETTYPGFTSCSNWVVKNNTFFNDRGAFFTNAASEGEAQADQQPHIGHAITNNKFTGDAGIRIASPASCVIAGNQGDSSATIALTDASTYPGYTPSCTIENNVMGNIDIGVLGSADTASWKEKVKFNNNTLLTSGDAISRQVGFGGAAYGVFDGIYTPNTSSPFSTEANSDHNNGNIIFIGGGDYPQLVTTVVDSTITGSPYTPSVKSRGGNIQMFGLVNGATINDTDNVPDGTILEFGVQANGSGANRVLTFDANYRLTDAWETNKDIQVLGQFVFMTFIRRAGVWHQLYECGWT